MSNLSDFVGGGSGLTLSPDLSFPSTLNSPANGLVLVTGVNTTAGLTEMLGLSGKYAIEFLQLNGLASESTQIKLTVDGEVIWDSTFALTATTLTLFGVESGTPFICNTDFSLEVQMSADTSIDVAYSVRKIV